MNHDFTPPTEEEYAARRARILERLATFKYSGVVVDHFNSSSCPVESQEPVTEQHLSVPMMGGVMSLTWSILPVATVPNPRDGTYPIPKYSELSTFRDLPETHSVTLTDEHPENPPPAIKYYDYDKKLGEWVYYMNTGKKNDPTVWRSCIGDYYDCSNTPLTETQLNALVIKP